MPRKTRLDAFISSTSYDLPQHRAAVIGVLNTLKIQPLGMEYWAVTGENPVELCKGHVSDAEIFIGIYGHRYGWQPDGHEGKSITELEYDWAASVNRSGKPIPRLCFIMSEDHLVAKDMIETEAEKQARLEAFKQRVKTTHVGFFNSVDDLARQVMAALVQVLDERYKANPEISCNLVPPPPDHFAGRADVLQELGNLLTTSTQTVAVTALKAIGGMGKTTLAKALAQQSQGRFGLMLWAELGEFWREDLEPGIFKRWARQLANREFGPELSLQQMVTEMRELLVQVIRESCQEPVLLIVDDVWATTLKSARLLCEAMPPGARILITTRSEDVAAKLDAYSLTLHEMMAQDGAALMAGLINDQRVDMSALCELSDILGGHPLSLQLAARQLRRNFQPGKLTETVQKLRQGIESGADFTDLKLDTGDTKVDSLSATLAQTLQNLSAKHQAQFRALGVLPADLSFSARHIAAIWGEADRDAMDDLVVEGLLTPSADSDDYYTQHRLLRAYARALLIKAGELDSARAKHDQYLIKLAAEGFAAPLENWLALVDDMDQFHALGNELVTLIAGTDNPAQQDERLQEFIDAKTLNVSAELMNAAEAFAEAVYRYINQRYIGIEGRRWLLAGLAAASAQAHYDKMSLFSRELGVWYDWRGRKRIALTYFEQSLQSAIAAGNKNIQALVLNYIGDVYADLEDREQALDYFGRALSLFTELDDQRGQAYTLNNIGKVYVLLKDYQKALDFYHQALPIRIALGDKGGQAYTLNNIGRTYSWLGDKQKTLDYYQQALVLRTEMGDKVGEAFILNNMAKTYARMGENHQALDYFNRALKLSVELGDKGGEAYTLDSIARAYAALGDDQQALDYYRRALPLREEVGNPQGEAMTRFYMAVTLWNQGQETEAIDQMQKAQNLKVANGLNSEPEARKLREWGQR